MNDRDKFLMRAKDIVLLVGAVAGLIAGMNRFVGLPVIVDTHTREITEVRNQIAGIARIEVQMGDVQRRLGRIENQMDTKP